MVDPRVCRARPRQADAQLSRPVAAPLDAAAATRARRREHRDRVPRGDDRGAPPGRGGGSVKIVAVVQARTGSTRLPYKILLPVAGATMLERMLARVSAAELIDEVVVATTVASPDDTI